MHILRIEIKSINDDKLNLINKSFKNMLSLDREINYESIIESYKVEETSVERKKHLKSIIVSEIFNKFDIHQTGDITSEMITIMIEYYENRLKHTNKLAEISKWKFLVEHIEILKDIARDLYLNIERW